MLWTLPGAGFPTMRLLWHLLLLGRHQWVLSSSDICLPQLVLPVGAGQPLLHAMLMQSPLPRIGRTTPVRDMGFVFLIN